MPILRAFLVILSTTADGVNLVPHLKGEIKTPPHDALYWRWMAQSAIREGHWKLLRGGEREYLYDLSSDLEEKTNLAAKHPEIATRLRAKLTAWCAELNPPGLALGRMAPTWNDYFDHYLDGKTVAAPPGKKRTEAQASADTNGWRARNGTLTANDGILTLTPEKGAAFLVRNGLAVTGPATAKVTLKATLSGEAAFAWRTADQKDFVPETRATFPVPDSDDWQTHDIALPAAGTIIHVRLHLPGGTTLIRELTITPDKKHL